jgi:hypothetical protein
MTVPGWHEWRHRALGLGRKLSGWPLVLGLLACGADGRYVMIGTARAPSASGIVEVDDIGGGSTQVAVHIEFLHPPSRLQEGLTRFVVWFVPGSGGTVRGGALRFDPEARTGDLTATSPFMDFEVKVTAERDDQPRAPSEFVVATQKISID